MKFNQVIITISVLWIFFGSCSSKMEIPAYLWVDSVDFQITNAADQGTASHKITDVWVTADGKSLGMYQIPARIPVLEDGVTRLHIEAGVMLGGVPQKRGKYPFYTIQMLNPDLKKGKIDTLIPHFTYTENAKFYWKEDFESAGILFTAYGKSAPMRKTSDEALLFHHPQEENNYSGIVELPYNDNDTATVYHFEIRTINPVELTYQSAYYCLMEINFCITHDVEIGMITHSANSIILDKQVPLANLTGYENISNQNPVWKKVYVNFTEEIGYASSDQMKNFDIYIRSTISTNEKARFLFDNIKLIYN